MNQYEFEYVLLEKIIATGGCTLEELLDTLAGLPGDEAKKLAALDNTLKSLAVERIGERYRFRRSL